MDKPKCRILCIDDHQDSSEMLKTLLSQEDYDVVTAASMAEALQLVKDEAFDLYVLDRHLPDGSGLDLCQKLSEITPGIPCVFYTGDVYELQRQEALGGGADAYVVKPDIDALIDAVQKLLAESECTTGSAAKV